MGVLLLWAKQRALALSLPLHQDKGQTEDGFNDSIHVTVISRAETYILAKLVLHRTSVFAAPSGCTSNLHISIAIRITSQTLLSQLHLLLSIAHSRPRGQQVYARCCPELYDPPFRLATWPLPGENLSRAPSSTELFSLTTPACHGLN